MAQTGQRKAVLPPVNFGRVTNPAQPEDITGSLSENHPSPGLENPYLKDTLALQHQIGLLERLIERQTVISQIESAYSEIGLPFHPVPPPREICEQLPPSIACSRGYPEIYRGKSKVSDISMDIDELLPEITPALESPVTKKPDPGTEKLPALLPDSMQEEKIPEKYNWAEVSCVGGRCKAVLVETGNPAIRKTVMIGDALPDGSVVSAISFDGVLLARGGKAIPLEPAKAPSRGGPSSAVLAGNAALDDGSGGGTHVPPPAPAGASPPPAVPVTKGSSPETAGSQMP